jgi:alanine racemase
MTIEWKRLSGVPFGDKLMASPPLARSSSNGLLVIDLAALRRNYRLLSMAVRPAACAAVVKADAYGLGLAPIVKALMAEDCNTFFVATLAEAKQLRAVAPRAAIYVLDGLFPDSAAEFAAAGVQPVLNSLEEARDWAGYNDRMFKRLPAAVHIDTGMNRLGFTAEETGRLAADAPLLENVPLSLAMSHLACADEPGHAKNAAQRDAFAALSAMLPAAARSLANSAGIFLGPRYHFDLARPGIALYGARFSAQGANPMEPVVSLYGRIAQVRVAEKGETVGYGAAKTLSRRTTLAIVAAGYADGYMRRLGSSDESEGFAVYLGDYRAPIIGRISMDLMAVDVTGLPESLVRRGALVELIGENIPVDVFAAAAGTIGYEILTSLGRRYERIYTGS